MKILIVGMVNSIHTARWVSQFSNQGWNIHLFPSYESNEIHPDFQNVTIYQVFKNNQKFINNIKVNGMQVFSKKLQTLGSMAMNKKYKDYRTKKLVNLIKKIKPDIIHSIEIQQAGYLTLEAKKNFSGKFPTWIVTNWGSDIYLFGRIKEHIPKIKEVLANCDYYSCECQRDTCLARNLGYRGKILPVFPNTGGFHLGQISKWRVNPTSKRKIIMLKGYYGWAGRSLVGLNALERCKELLKGYEIVIHSPLMDGIFISNEIPSVMSIAAELFTNNTGIPVRIMPQGTPHNEILKLYGESRISIGLSISDAISTSFLEALVMGSFPVQSWTSCANEWIENGKTGILVPPEDPDVIEKVLRKVLTDDKLVDSAAKINSQTAKKRLDYTFLKNKTIEMYETVYKHIADNN